jgi:hypothetical protein
MEGQQVIDTLDGKRPQLSSLAEAYLSDRAISVMERDRRTESF